tara:strand:+ start:5652 stop:5828 length:177 start_codon:yes stop_codon:yes gene_type:complete
MTQKKYEKDSIKKKFYHKKKYQNINMKEIKKIDLILSSSKDMLYMTISSIENIKKPVV